MNPRNLTIGRNSLKIIEVGITDEYIFEIEVGPDLEEKYGISLLYAFGRGDDRFEAINELCFSLRQTCGWSCGEAEMLESILIGSGNHPAHGPDCCRKEYSNLDDFTACSMYYWIVAFTNHPRETKDARANR